MSLKAIVEDHLWEYENFLTEDELQTLMGIVADAAERSWSDNPDIENPENYVSKALNITDHEVGRKIVNSLNDRISSLFIDTTKLIKTGFIIRNSNSILPKGLHRDDIDLSSPTGVCDCTYGIVMYLNSDFTGGELIYPELGVEYTPKRGSLVVHRAHELHGVNDIQDGMRYSMTAFMWGCDAQVVGI